MIQASFDSDHPMPSTVKKVRGQRFLISIHTRNLELIRLHNTNAFPSCNNVESEMEICDRQDIDKVKLTTFCAIIIMLIRCISL